jgi:hypothetical protein
MLSENNEASERDQVTALLIGDSEKRRILQDGLKKFDAFNFIEEQKKVVNGCNNKQGE